MRMGGSEMLPRLGDSKEITSKNTFDCIRFLRRLTGLPALFVFGNGLHLHRNQCFQPSTIIYCAGAMKVSKSSDTFK